MNVIISIWFDILKPVLNKVFLFLNLLKKRTNLNRVVKYTSIFLHPTEMKYLDFFPTDIKIPDKCFKLKLRENGLQ